ncbi:MAG: hypothetical protein IH859_07030, partial [Chloroflexi bacterium]|nr:hypothetical protein [Chloroflexota bacterium]
MFENIYRGTVNEYLAKIYLGKKGKTLLLKENTGSDIRPTASGKAKVFEKYFKLVPKYFQVIDAPTIPPNERLAVVGDTDIVVDCEINHNNGGKLVILPPPIIYGDYFLSNMSTLVDVAKHYYEKIQRHIPIVDAPDWVETFKSTKSKVIAGKMSDLKKEKEKFDLIEYSLFGTGDELEQSITCLLEDLGLKVEPQPKGANIDLKASHQKMNIGFALEVTGTKGTIKKKSNKV